MFDYLPFDTMFQETPYELMGAHIENDLFNIRLRNDLRLLLATGDPPDLAVKRMESVYIEEIRTALKKYDAEFYESIFYVCIAYYLEQNGYYDEKTFQTAISFLKSGNTLKPFEDAALIHEGVPVSCARWISIDISHMSDEDILEYITDYRLPNKHGKIEGWCYPRTVMNVRRLKGHPKKILEARKKHLTHILSLLQTRPHPFRKLHVSDVIKGSRKMRFSCDFCEGDAIAYCIKSGKFAGKWVVFVLGHLREFYFVHCEQRRIVAAYEEFALLDFMFDERPSAVPDAKYRALYEVQDHAISYIELTMTKQDYRDFSYVPLGKTRPPQFERYWRSEHSLHTCSHSVQNTQELDALLTQVFST